MGAIRRKRGNGYRLMRGHLYLHDQGYKKLQFNENRYDHATNCIECLDNVYKHNL